MYIKQVPVAVVFAACTHRGQKQLSLQPEHTGGKSSCQCSLNTLCLCIHHSVVDQLSTNQHLLNGQVASGLEGQEKRLTSHFSKAHTITEPQGVMMTHTIYGVKLPGCYMNQLELENKVHPCPSNVLCKTGTYHNVYVINQPINVTSVAAMLHHLQPL